MSKSTEESENRNIVFAELVGSSATPSLSDSKLVDKQFYTLEVLGLEESGLQLKPSSWQQENLGELQPKLCFSETGISASGY